MTLALACYSSLGGQTAVPAASAPEPHEPHVVIDWQRPVVLLFHSIDCPISDRYVPVIKRLQKKYATDAATMDVYLVFPNHNEDNPDVREYVEERDLTLPFLRDHDAALTRLSGAQVTPEAVVLMPGPGGPELVYRGRYDDRYARLGQSRPRATVQYLDVVLAAVASGERPEFEDTGAVGCYIVNEAASAGGRDRAERAQESHFPESHAH